MLQVHKVLGAFGVGTIVLAGAAGLWQEAGAAAPVAPAAAPAPQVTAFEDLPASDQAGIICRQVLQLTGAMRLTMYRPLGEILADFDDMPEFQWIGYMVYDFSQVEYSEARDRRFMRAVEERCFRNYL